MLSAVALYATLAAALASAPAAAPVGRAQLEVHAAEDCTNRKDLIARVMARSPRIEFVEDAAATILQVTITQSHGTAANALRRDSYQFKSDVFYETSRLTTSASLGVGLRLW